MEEDQEKRRSFLVEWLEKLQQESWQLELLISGLALYGILESRELLEEIHILVDQRAFGTFKFLGDLAKSFVNTAWVIGAINLFAHIFLRGLWIGAIGLRYVSGDIDYSTLGYSNYFSNFFRRRIGTYDDFIERLEKVCSTIFAYTFLLFFLFLSLNLFLIPLAAPMFLLDINPNESETGILWWLLYAFIYCTLGLIVFIDFITAGALKKVKDRGFSRMYGAIYRLFSLITLSFIYRPILYNFLDNKYGRRWFYFSVPYIFLTLVLPSFSFSTHAHFPNSFNARSSEASISNCRYDDLREAALDLRDKPGSGILCRGQNISLSKFRVDGDMLEFFIPLRKHDYSWLSEQDSIYHFQERGLATNMTGPTQKPYAEDDENEAEKAIRLIYEAQIDSISELRKENLRHRKDSNYVAIDYDEELARFKLEYKDAINQHQLDNMRMVQDALVQRYNLELNGIDITDQVTAFFYIHPYRRSRGIKCLVSIDKLAHGMHSFSFRFTSKTRNVKLNKGKLTSSVTEQLDDRFYLPFVKISDGAAYKGVPQPSTQTTLPSSTQSLDQAP